MEKYTLTILLKNKKRNLPIITVRIIYLFGLFLFLSVKAQTILNSPENSSKEIKDPVSVILANGFHSSSNNGNTFVAYIGNSKEENNSFINSDAGNSNPYGTIGSNIFHDTQGNIDINGGGQLQFTLPIALPPGIKSVAPQINLIYTSGSTNGIAGYGFNLSGITAISIIGKNIEKDGETKGIQLDYSDNYSFNGQRLILKSGKYCKNSAEYVTEKFSNVKIKSLGTITGQIWKGPEYWEITFEDGSQAWYGATKSEINNARTPIEYNIVKWRDAQGNYISYNYSQQNNVALISSIQWGGNESLNKPHFNQIIFNYKERYLIESSFVAGLELKQSKILDFVQVNANGSQFKKYAIHYDNGTRGSRYQFVKNITEYNANNEPANPIIFEYDNLNTDSGWKKSLFSDKDNQKLTGDFDGDGKTDLLIPISGLESLHKYRKWFYKKGY